MSDDKLRANVFSTPPAMTEDDWTRALTARDSRFDDHVRDYPIIVSRSQYDAMMEIIRRFGSEGK